MRPHLRSAALALLLAASILPVVDAPARASDLNPLSAADPSARGRTDDLVAGQLIVRFRPGTERRAQDRALAAHGARRGRGLGLARTVLVEVEPGHELEAAEKLGTDPTIAWAEPDRYRLTADHEGSETLTWPNTGAVNADDVWADSTGAGVRVAVLDTGVDGSVADLAGRVVAGMNFVGEGAPTTSVGDVCGHGTSVAGVVAANHDGSGVVGTAPGATVVPVKVGDNACSIAISDSIQGITWAADPSGGNATVINMSYGSEYPSAGEAAAVAQAVAAGVSVVASAGNFGDEAELYPAGYPDVISVGALDASNNWSTFSSFGKVDIAAPGEDITVLQTATNGGATELADGTSFASPIVAGTIALLLEDNAGATPWKLRQLVLGTATEIGGPGIDLRTGHGAVDAGAAYDSVLSGTDLVTIEAPQRWLAANNVASIPLSVRVSDHTGTALAGEPVGVSPPSGMTAVLAGGSSATTGLDGEQDRTLKATAIALGTPTLSFSVDGVAHSMRLRVVAADDEIPGTPLLANRSDSVHLVTDRDDVFSVFLYEGQQLQLTVKPGASSAIGVALFTGAAKRVFWDLDEIVAITDDYVVEPTNLAYTALATGVYYVDVFGFGLSGENLVAGSYALSAVIPVTGKISSVSAAPTPFSPNGDGVKDSTKVTVKTAATGTLTIQVRRTTDGAVIRSRPLGTKAAGTYTWSWDGRRSDGRVVADGTFQIAAVWNSGPRRHIRTANVRVDNAKPAVTNISDAPDPFYPYPDGYKDLHHITFRVYEKVTAEIRYYKHGSSTIVIRQTRSLDPGLWQAYWNGVNRDGNIIAAGYYDYVLIMTDRAGNKTTTARRTVRAIR